MIDWRDFFPVDALAPLIGGLLLWFGVNYLVLAPNVIGPRLAEKYYTPACLASVEAGRAELAQRFAAADAEWLERAEKNSREIRQKYSGSGGVFGGIIGMYGAEGQRFMQKHGNTLSQWGSGPLEQAISQGLAEARAQYDAKRKAEIDELRRAQRYSDAPAFCGCNVAAGMSDKLDLALFTSTVRLYKPAGIADLEAGRVFDQCGTAPVV
ncbi:hypothetical protein [Aerobium aerolatum]|uniref:Uncharacterized protein n=1 Tax=Aquamicrobium aerolatum DSM 21857 TaxID=1121003 RepID=A0A1I3SV32_9HYPH|nr:hypothetical protein [Aquamicrobium aerolatum]SFJ62062.1 hypothetical protein SAMN03080618_03469 [Aquamicrobium aerolatum DSM 21857]